MYPVWKRKKKGRKIFRCFLDASLINHPRFSKKKKKKKTKNFSVTSKMRSFLVVLHVFSRVPRCIHAFVPPRYRLLYLHPTFVPRANPPISIYLPFYHPVYTIPRSAPLFPWHSHCRYSCEEENSLRRFLTKYTHVVAIYRWRRSETFNKERSVEMDRVLTRLLSPRPL